MMTHFSLTSLSAIIGLCTTATLTFNLLLGWLLSLHCKKFNGWKSLPAHLQKININNLHNQTAYLVLALVLLHPILLLFDAETKFYYTHLLSPLKAPHQPFYVTLGVIFMYGIIVVILASQKK